MYGGRLYAKNPVLEIVHEESAKLYHIHMFDGNIQQNPPCAESCVTEEFPISPRFSAAFFSSRCNFTTFTRTSFVNIMH